MLFNPLGCNSQKGKIKFCAPGSVLIGPPAGIHNYVNTTVVQLTVYLLN